MNKMKKIKNLLLILSLTTFFCNDYSIQTYTLSAYQGNTNWAIDYLDLPEAWDFVVGSSDVTVGVADSGIQYNHNEIYGILDTSNCYDLTVGIDTLESQPIDETGHGTQVAGIISSNNINYNSVCENVNLVSLKTHEYSEYILEDNIGNAYIKANELNLPILNASIGIKLEDNGLFNHFNEDVNDYSGLAVIAAGNYGINLDDSNNNVYPACYNSSNIICVGAIDSLEERWVDEGSGESSDYGLNTVDIYAPGENIETITKNSGYTQAFGGTSSAAAFVSGVAALLKSLNPSLTTSQLKSSILNSANIISITLPDGSLQSVKSLNAYNAVKYVLENYPANECSIEEYSNVTFSNYVNTNNTVANDDYSMIKINVEYDYNYEIHLSSLSPIEFTLYDSNFNEVEVDYQYTNNNWTIDIEDNYFDIGVYYLKTNYVNGGSGTINVNICDPHEHDFCIDSIITEDTNDYHYGKCACGTYGYEEHEFGAPYSYISVLQHNTTCVECEYVKAMPHAVINGSTNCIQCGGYANVGINPYSINSNEVVYITENGSYILPNGIIVLDEKDVTSYLKGTLQFYIKENNFEIA